MPRQGSKTANRGSVPDVQDYYRKLEEGLRLTLDGGLATHADAVVAHTGAVNRGVQLEELAAAMKAARAQIDEINGREGRRSGIGTARSALASVKAELAAFKGGSDTVADEIARTEAALDCLSGATLPRHPTLQFGDQTIGRAKFGVYAFYDFDGHAMYVGKTTEGVSTRIRRHLSNQRTDAVAMGALDPLEVAEVEVWPLWVSADQDTSDESKRNRDAATRFVNELEYAVELRCIDNGWELFNEKRIPKPETVPPIPASVRFALMNDEARERLSHPDLRIARRATVIARLAGKIADRELRDSGLRQSLRRQLKRLTKLSDDRFDTVGGERSVAEDTGSDDS
ncbi:MAG: GIY-YIG nuclease family protein [Cellulomonas sp.]